MKYAIVINDVVVNIIESESAFASMFAKKNNAIAIQSETAKIGQKYIDGIFSDLVDNHQEHKPLRLKQAENDYLSVVAMIPGVVAGDNSNVIAMKLETSTELTDIQRVSIGIKLLAFIHDVELAGGSFYDLPVIPHILPEESSSN